MVKRFQRDTHHYRYDTRTTQAQLVSNALHPSIPTLHIIIPNPPFVLLNRFFQLPKFVVQTKVEGSEVVVAVGILEEIGAEGFVVKGSVLVEWIVSGELVHNFTKKHSDYIPYLSSMEHPQKPNISQNHL